jgi:hypothetical protein
MGAPQHHPSPPHASLSALHSPSVAPRRHAHLLRRRGHHGVRGGAGKAAMRPAARP